MLDRFFLVVCAPPRPHGVVNACTMAVKSALSVCFEGQVDFFPRDYHEYFLDVYHKAQTIYSIFELSPPHIRIFSGHAVGNFGDGYFEGSILIQKPTEVLRT